MSAVETHWPAPAKLNLFLHVTGRRADGYHELQTLFQLIDLTDTVTISVRTDGRIERTAGPAGGPPRPCRPRPAPPSGQISRCANAFPRAGAWAVAARMRLPCCWH